MIPTTWPSSLWFGQMQYWCREPTSSHFYFVVVDRTNVYTFDMCIPFRWRASSTKIVCEKNLLFLELEPWREIACEKGSICCQFIQVPLALKLWTNRVDDFQLWRQSLPCWPSPDLESLQHKMRLKSLKISIAWHGKSVCFSDLLHIRDRFYIYIYIYE